MHDVQIQCPFCFEMQWFEVVPDERGTLIYDCEVCCRPMEIVISWPNETPQVVVRRAQ